MKDFAAIDFETANQQLSKVSFFNASINFK